MSRILLDTDIGDDIDDAYCLAYLLAHPDAELVGVTTVGGDAARRAALADAMCLAAGRADVPIIAGCGHTLAMRPLDVPCRQAAVLDQFAHRAPERFAPNHAVDFIIEQILAAPGELTILGIGPLTNLALVCATRPDLLDRIGRVVLMNGVYLTDDHGSEWNSRCDPVATWTTFRSGLPIDVVGLDVTDRCTQPVGEERARVARLGGPFDVVRAALSVWERECATVTYHDPLAAAMLFEPQLCTWAEGTVEPDLMRIDRQPMTRWHPHSGGIHRVAVDVDPIAFLTHFDAVAAAAFDTSQAPAEENR